MRHGDNLPAVARFSGAHCRVAANAEGRPCHPSFFVLKAFEGMGQGGEPIATGGATAYHTTKDGCDTVMNLAAVARACPERIVGLPHKREPGPTIRLFLFSGGD